MSNYSARILNNARGSLTAQQAVIANVGNNIANVNTPNYARRKVSLETNSNASAGLGLQIGSGVRIGSVVRITDSFIDRLHREAIGDNASAAMKDNFLRRVETLFDLTGQRDTIGSTLSEFYTALNDLSVNPASIELRTNVVERTGRLINTIRETYNSIAALQTEADQRLAEEIEAVNSITSRIAEINAQIQIRERGAGSVAADERDAREALVNELASKLSFQRVDLADGTLNIVLSNGLPLVAGTNSRQLETTINPTFASGSLPASLGGGVLSYVVANYGSGAAPSHVDLTGVLKQGQGSIGGILAMRGYADPTNLTAFEADGFLVEMASRVEALTRSLLTTVNATYRGPDRDIATPGFQPSSGDLDGNVPDVFGLFDFDYSGAKDVATIGRPTVEDLNALLASGAVDNFSSILQQTFTDPRRFAAARFTGPAGAPIFAPGDNRNIQALLDQREVSQVLTVGHFTLHATYDNAYVEAVTAVGNAASGASVTLSVTRDNLVAAENKRGEISGVSLDEEFSSLIQFQKVYQASARMIRTGDELLNEILSLI